MMQHQKIEKKKNSLETPIGITTVFHNKKINLNTFSTLLIDFIIFS
jgi:hypothetical protein